MAFTLYQLLLAENTPRTNYVPLMGLFIVCSFVLAALHLLASLIILRIHHFAEYSLLAPHILRAWALRPVCKTKMYSTRIVHTSIYYNYENKYEYSTVTVQRYNIKFTLNSNIQIETLFSLVIHVRVQCFNGVNL